jgi:phosphoserine phosphatase
MSLVATLICNPADPALDSPGGDARLRLLPSPGPAQWLFDEVAVDIPFEGSTTSIGIDHRLREARGDLPIDIVGAASGVPVAEAFSADMDSTMIGQECIDELADFAGSRRMSRASPSARCAARSSSSRRCASASRCSKGLPVGVVDEVLKKRITADAGRPRTGHDHARHGAYTCLISGGFTLFTSGRRDDRIPGKPRQ